MRLLPRFVVCAVALSAVTVWAHGPQIQVTNDNGKIITREVFPAGPYNSLTSQKLVYVMPISKAVSDNPSTAYWQVMPNSAIDPILNVSQYQFGPGLAYGYGHTFDAGQHFNVNFLDSLLRWNGAAFANNPGPEEIGAFRGDSLTSADTAFTTDSAPFQGLVFNNLSATYNAESHSSMRFRVLGDGASAVVAPQDGIYLLKLQATSTQPGLAASDPFFFVLHNNATSDSLAQAVNSLGFDSSLVQHVVPEPVSAGLALILVLVLGGTRFTLRK